MNMINEKMNGLMLWESNKTEKPDLSRSSGEIVAEEGVVR